METAASSAAVASRTRYGTNVSWDRLCSDWKVGATFDQTMWAETAGLECRAMEAEERVGMLGHRLEGDDGG